VTLTSGTGYSPEGQAEAGMGTDAADYDGDGRLDIVVTNYDLETNGLYRNDGDWLFSDERWPAGLAKTDRFFLGFGTAFFDFDNDGDQDLLIVNGHVLDNAEQVRDEIRYAQPIQLLENQQGRFSESLSFASYASKSPRVGRGASLGDVDNDGDVDILVSNSGQKPVLLMNQSTSANNWLLLKLVGTHCNRDAVGAMIVVTSHTGRQVSQIRGGRSYLSASDIRVHFGLGSWKTAEELKIRWPCGSEEVFRDIKANQILTINEGGSRG
jgi:enediyne biosynthesis protein E4